MALSNRFHTTKHPVDLSLIDDNNVPAVMQGYVPGHAASIQATPRTDSLPVSPRRCCSSQTIENFKNLISPVSKIRSFPTDPLPQYSLPPNLADLVCYLALCYILTPANHKLKAFLLLYAA